MSFDLVITNAGRAALVNAANTGTLPVTITQIGISATFTAPVPSLAALPAEIKRLSSIAGDVVAEDTIHVTLRDESADAYALRGVALYLADGTLFAVAGQASPLINKTASSIALAAFDITFADFAAAAVSFGSTDFMLPPATTEVQGVVELATVAEAQAGTDAQRALTPQGGKAAVSVWLQGLDLVLGRVEVATPNAGTTGGLRVRSNQASGQALVQITNHTGGAQWGFWRHTAAGDADWIGAGNLRSGGALAWTAANDGAGSGLDADTLDGLHAAQIMAAVDQAIARAIPRGVIVEWSGAVTSIPAGWALCDGSNGTPNLVNRFVIGAGGDLAPGATGGAAEHGHTGTAGTATTGITIRTTTVTVDQDSTPPNVLLSATPNDPGHTHALAINPASSLPPFYALAFIMKL